MGDEMAVLLIILAIFLYWVYRKSNTSGYSSELPVKPGTHRIGEDLPPGKGDLVAISGGGTVTIKERGGSAKVTTFKLHASNSALPSRYRNLKLCPLDILEISGNMETLITPAKSISDVNGAELTQGVYKFGADIPAAKYNLKAVSGDGKVSIREANAADPSFSQDMNTAGEDKSSVYENILCEAGSQMTVEGSLKIKLTLSQKQHNMTQRFLDFLNQDP